MKEKLKSIKDSLVEHIVPLIVGVFFGSVIPVFVFIHRGKISIHLGSLGDLGEWVGAIATFAAVIVSLYYSRKSNKASLSVEGRYAPLLGDQNFTFEIQNTGNIPAQVYMSIELDSKFTSSYLGAYAGVDANVRNLEDISNEQYFNLAQAQVILRRKLDPTLFDEDGKNVNTNKSYTVPAHGAFSGYANTMLLMGNLATDSPISQQALFKLVVKSFDGFEKKIDIIKFNVPSKEDVEASDIIANKIIKENEKKQG